ncbi:MAG: nicotinate-nucleotide--dimethylbenzimidazole phosphoribosyltransferase, partial [Firmicutes bacterium]|nr:nicotinate-nucleotide--dimethylbenzimidazole phosphoribosyltransferase [Bacillota bacterium]
MFCQLVGVHARLFKILLQKPPEEITARGAGAPERVAHKAAVIRKALDVNRPCPADPLDVLAKVGGLDIAALCGLYIGAAACGLTAMLDGVISCTAALAAVRLAPAVQEYLLPSHCSAERVGSLLLEALDKKPLITAGLCLGEGTGGDVADDD